MPASNSLTLLSSFQTTTRLPTSAQVLIWIAATLTRWSLNRRTRRTLAGLTDWELDDIGVSRDQAEAEARKPFFW